MSGRAAANTLRMRSASRMSASSKLARRATAPREVLALAGGQVVDDRHLVAAIEERVDEVRADEAGAAGDQGTHGRRILRQGRPMSGRPGPPGA